MIQTTAGGGKKGKTKDAYGFRVCTYDRIFADRSSGGFAGYFRIPHVHRGIGCDRQHFKVGSVVYLKGVSNDSYVEGNIVAVQESDSSRKVDVYYVDANDTAAQTLAIREGEAVSYEQIAGKVVAKTPFIGYLSQLCFSAAGIIVTILIFAAGLGLMMYVNKISKEINQALEDQKSYS